MASIVPRPERSELMTLRDAVDRLFQESFVRPWSFASALGTGVRGMEVDLYDEGENLMVEATMPGVKTEDIDIRVQGDVLTISAETKQEKDISEDRYTYKERSYGRIQRSITLPTRVDANKAEARLEDGVLKLTLPKVESEKSRQIKVKGS